MLQIHSYCFSVICYCITCHLIGFSLQNTTSFAPVAHHNGDSSRIFSNETICQLPTFLQTALGVTCRNSGNLTQQNGAHFLFAMESPPVWTLREPNGTCPNERFEWNSFNSSLCCLVLACPPGQVLAKDERNTPDGGCPKCKNIVFEYHCDPLNDTCATLQKGTVCRNFFNSTNLHVCACDNEHGYTQNRMAFPVTCTKTIGAVCFLQEHCKFVDQNARCSFDDGSVHSPRGVCGCKNGTHENDKGRCVEDKIPKASDQPKELAQIRKVRQTAVADWGDKSLWENGPIEKFPYYDLNAIRKRPKPSSVIQQRFTDYENNRSPRENSMNITVVNSFIAISNTSSTTPRTTGQTSTKSNDLPTNLKTLDSPATATTASSSGNITNRPTPANYMIAAQHIVSNVSKDAHPVGSSQAVSGTRIIPSVSENDNDVQVDNLLNIVRPAGARKRPDRPTSTETSSISTSTSTSSSGTKIPYWERSSGAPQPVFKLNDLSTVASTTQKITTAKPVRQTFAPAIRFTKSPILPDIAIIQVQHDRESQDNDAHSTTAVSEEPTSTATSTQSITIRAQTSTSSPTSTTTKTTTKASTTKQTSASTYTVLSTKSSTKATTTQSRTAETDSDNDHVSINSNSGVLTVKVKEIPRRFGGGSVRLPSLGVIGGVDRGTSFVSETQTRSVQWFTAVTRSSSTTPSTTTLTKSMPADHGVDFSFLHDTSISKAEMQEKLIQALLELSATTTATTITTPTTTTTKRTTITSTTPKPSVDLSFLTNSKLSPEELQKRLLPLLMQLNEELKSTTTAKSTSASITGTITPTTTTTTTSPRTTSVKSTTADATYPIPIPHRKKNVSFFGALFNTFTGLGSRRSRPHSSSNSIEDPNGDLEATTTVKATTTTTTTTKIPTTTTPTTTAARKRYSATPAVRDQSVATTESSRKKGDTSGLSVPGFSDVLSGLGALFGSVLGGRPRPDGSSDTLSNSLAGLKTDGGKLDLSDPKVQQQVAKLMQQASPKGGAGLSSLTSLGGANGKFDFHDSRDQTEFVSFLKNFDKYQPSSSQQSGYQSSLFPKPPPGSDGSSSPETAIDIPVPEPLTTSTTQRPTGPVPIAIAVDGLSPEAIAILKQMQKPGYYNLTKEQAELIQPVLKEIRDRVAQQGLSTPFVPPPTTIRPIFHERPGVVNYQFLESGGGDPWAGNAGNLLVPPVFPVPFEILPPGTTTTTTTTTTTRPVAEGKMMAPLSDVKVQFVQAAPLVKQPQQPALSAILPTRDCPVDCRQQDSFSLCDTKIGACVCLPGYRSSLLMGNGCTKTLFSLCSADEDCRSGGDANAECSFNGQNRFCTCTNGYLADSNGVCKPMFTERCTTVCNIPNAVCDQTRGVCRCPTGYAWYRDPWTGQAVCRAAVGGNVPCRSAQDLCPIYTPRGKCTNNAFCGCEDGYIPDSWFTNRSERTNCIDVLSAKCDDNSDCTAGDRNTICDRRLRMCVCKAGFKPDPFHSAACVPSF